MVTKLINSILFVILAPIVFSQNWTEKTKRALPKNDELYDVESYKPTQSDYLFYSDSCDLFEKVTKSYFSKAKTWKRIPIKNSLILNELCKHAVLGLNVSKTNKASKHNYYLRRLGKTLVGTNRTYAYIEFTSFDIPAVKLQGRYFYDTENGDSPYHLYTGKAPTKKEIEDGTAAFIPCKIFNEEEIAEKIEHKIRSSRLYSYVSRQEVFTFGIGAIPKKKTVYRKAVPTIRVFIVVGIKRINEKKLGTGKYRSKLRRKKRKTLEEVEHLPNVLKKKQ